MNHAQWLDMYYYIGGGALFVMMLTWPVFMIFSVRRIEKKIIRAGKPRPCQWDPFWGRAFFYAWTMTLPTKNYSELEIKLLDPKLVIPYANFFDNSLGFILFVSSWIFIITAIIGLIFGIG